MISIIIPCYNSIAYIGHCLDSIGAQTYSDLQVVCVDDGSTDGTAELLQEYAHRDKRFEVLLNNVNSGISAARNRGLAAARGEWVMFVDSDDWTDVVTCEKALALATAHKADMVMWCYTRELGANSNPKIFYPEERVWEEDIRCLQRRIFGPYGEELRHPEDLDSWGTVWGKIYRRGLIEADSPLRFVDNREVGTAEDVVFNIDYTQRIHKAVYVPQPWYHYRKTMESYTNRRRDGLVVKWDKLFDTMEHRISQYNLAPDFTEALRNRMAIGVLGLGITELRGAESWRAGRKAIGSILHRDRQSNALREMKLEYMPLHWRIFYYAARHKLSFTVTMMLTAINRIISNTDDSSQEAQQSGAPS